MTQYILCSVGLAFVENDHWHVTTRVLYLVACRFFVAYVVSPFMILQTLCCERCAHWNQAYRWYNKRWRKCEGGAGGAII